MAGLPRTFRSIVLLGILALSGAASARAQALVDTLFSWQGYGRQGLCRVRIYGAAGSDTSRTHLVVLEERAENQGPSTAEDVRHLAEVVGRAYEVDPSAAYWVLHWGGFSFEGAKPERRRELFLRASFRRTKSGSLSSPTWRLLTREEVEALTDRQFR